MFFVIKTNPIFIDLDRLKAKLQARSFILLSKPNTNDILLNRYLIENYKISLKSLCLNIINNAIIMINAKNEIIIKIPDKKLNKLATLITFGNEKVMGSNILKEAFKQ